MTSEQGEDQQPWFRAIADSAPEIYFRYAQARFEYLSPSVQALTGYSPNDFYRDATLCVRLFAKHDRRALRQAVRARRGLTFTLHLRSHADQGRDEPRVLHVRTVPVIRRHQLVAVEGVATIVDAAPSTRHHDGALQPVQQQLTALLYQVHSLLHLNPPQPPVAARAEIRLGDLALDTDSLTVTEQGAPVKLTGRELLVLKYLLTRQGRIVTREQMLKDVWQYSYTGDHRTVDVHVSRLRKKLPSLRDRLVAIKNIGYRIEGACSRRSA